MPSEEGDGGGCESREAFQRIPNDAGGGQGGPAGRGETEPWGTDAETRGKRGFRRGECESQRPHLVLPGLLVLQTPGPHQTSLEVWIRRTAGPESERRRAGRRPGEPLGGGAG